MTIIVKNDAKEMPQREETKKEGRKENFLNIKKKEEQREREKENSINLSVILFHR